MKCTFIGQAGFIFTSSSGCKIGIDLYLSDCCQRLYGYKRLMPFIVDPKDLSLDFVVATHHHEDHFDVDSIPILLKQSKTELITSFDCKEKINNLEMENKNITYVKVGDVIKRTEFRLVAISCDHGESAPQAIGLLLEIDSKRIYIAGDTALRRDRKQEVLEYGDIDLMICPINGMFGNMNEQEAAEYTAVIQPRTVVPCHYWNFAEHQGNPYIFEQILQNRYPNQPYIIMRMGETITVEGALKNE